MPVFTINPLYHTHNPCQVNIAPFVNYVNQPYHVKMPDLDKYAVDIIYRAVYSFSVDEKSNVKKTILAKALKLFSAKGYEAVSVSELTEAAGITKPTLYYYFGCKEGVFASVCQSHYAELDSIIAENTVYISNPHSYHEDIYLTLSKLASGFFSFAQANKAFYQIYLTNSSMPHSSSVFEIVKKYHYVHFEIIKEMFINMSKAHGNLKGKGNALAWSFIGIINSYISLCFSKISGQQLNEKAVKELVHQFMHGIYS
jgi:AcrR family transcriptional regulator